MIRRKARLQTKFVETRNPQYLKDYKKLRNEVRRDTRILAKKNNVKYLGSASQMQKRSGGM